ncbi:MAG: glycosyltransferase family 2 protein [bacterium]
MEDYHVVCLCPTYGRPNLLAEAVQCFLCQDYQNKELIILNDQKGVNLHLSESFSNITIINYDKRFDSLGEKRNYLNQLGLEHEGDMFCIWDDDDLYTPWRITESVQAMINDNSDIVKTKFAFMSIDNKNYKVVSNLFHSQACISKQYIKQNRYPAISVGEDVEFEKNAMIKARSCFPCLWYIYRWGMNIHHLSGISNEKHSWEKSLYFEPYNQYEGDIEVKPYFKNDYWQDIELFLDKNNSNNFVKHWTRQIKESARN